MVSPLVELASSLLATVASSAVRGLSLETLVGCGQASYPYL